MKNEDEVDLLFNIFAHFQRHVNSANEQRMKEMAKTIKKTVI